MENKTLDNLICLLNSNIWAGDARMPLHKLQERSWALDHKTRAVCRQGLRTPATQSLIWPLIEGELRDMSFSDNEKRSE